MQQQMLEATPKHLRFSRSCAEAAREFVAAMPADNVLRPVQPSERIFKGKHPSRESLRTSLHVAAQELGAQLVTVTLNDVMFVAKVDTGYAMQTLVEKFKERDAAYPAYAPLALVSTFDEI